MITDQIELLFESFYSHGKQHELRFRLHFTFLGAGVTLVHANLCMHILVSLLTGLSLNNEPVLKILLGHLPQLSGMA